MSKDLSSKDLTPQDLSTDQPPSNTLAPEPAEAREKHGDLYGGVATEEALASSRRVLLRSRGQGPLIGLQQWFSPPEAADLIASVFGDPRAVLDPTAGSGALLGPYPEEARFGIEIDRDHTKSAPYRAIGGDAQHAVPLMRAAGLRFPALALNPPFGLSWKDGAHAKGETNSTTLAFLWALDLMDRFGQGAMICGRDRLATGVLNRPEARGVYAMVDVDGPLFDGVELPTSIAFFVRPENLERHYLEDPDLQPARFRASRATLSEMADAVTGTRDRRSLHVSGHCDLKELTAGFAAVGKEHERRSTSRRKKNETRHDLSIKGRKISVHLSAFATLALSEAGRLREVQLLHNQHAAYFAQNPKTWREIREARENGLLSVSPDLADAAAKALAEADRQSTPLFPVKQQMRLGWLTDLDKIRCKNSEPELGFVAGEDYSLSTRSKVSSETEQRTVENKHGEPELRRFTTERRLLEVRIGSHTFDEGNEAIGYITENFELPDPGCVATRFPEEVARNRWLLEQMEKEIRHNHAAYWRERGVGDVEPFAFKEFQIDHLSRLLVKGRGMLAMEQGLGKSLMQMALAEAQVRLGAKEQVLIVSPQDLLDQWQDQSRMFFGREMEMIRTPEQARRVARRIEAGETGWFVTYFECLSVVGRKRELLPHRPLDHRIALQERLVDHKRKKKRKAGEDPTTVPLPPEGATTRDACPECGATTERVYPEDGYWNGESCTECGYTRRALYKKSAYSHLTTAFKRGVKCIDEVSEIRGDDSLRSKAIRAMARGAHNYGATGTPISNFCNDIYWSLWYCLGDANAAFPYSYEGGKSKFESDFCVVEYLHGREEDEEGNVRKRRKVLPQITNVSQFWRLAQPGVSRCRKEQTGEPLVKRTYHPVSVPMGVRQKQAHRFWLSRFADYFKYKHPHHSLVRQGLVDKFAAALGQLWRLETASTLPASDEPSREWSEAAAAFGELSNWTPATLKVLELPMEHVAKGEKVLIGSDLIETGPWIAARLNEKGVRAVHITEEKAGKTGTKNPRKRAREVREFVEGDAQVLCAGVNALKLGHDLSQASTVILHGLPYSFMSADQFIARVHRLTSKRDVSVYVVIPRGSLAQEKWQLLSDKGGASDLALDGELSVEPEEAVDWSKVLREMKARGIAADGDEVLEEDVEAAWNRTPALAMPATTFPTLLERASSGNAAPSRREERPPSLLDLLAEAGSGKHDTREPSGPAEQLALFEFTAPSDEPIEAA